MSENTATEHNAEESTNNGLNRMVKKTINELKDGDNKAITVLTGTVTEEERFYRKKLTLHGTLSAPYEFYRHRKTKHLKHEEKVAHLLIDKAKGKITLVLDEEDMKPNPTTRVHGVLEANPDLVGLYINQPSKTFGVKELQQHLKFNRAMFTDRQRNMDIVANLSAFTVNVEKEISMHDDFKGNVLNKIEQKVRQDINLSFSITAPIFKGTPEKTFEVTVGVTVGMQTCTFWLESVDLRDLEYATRNTAIDEQVEKFNDEIVVIETTSGSGCNND